MSDDIARQRFWSWNNAKSDPNPRLLRMPKSRSSGPARSPTAEATHVLMVKPNDRREWLVVADRSGRSTRDVAGSEAFCQAELERRSRHFPDSQFRVLPWPLARAELRRKTWSVSDEDHIPVGSEVMLRRAPAKIHPGLAKMNQAFGLSREREQRRTGVVKSRYCRSGDYMVALDGTDVTVCVARVDLIYPVPENVVALERRHA